MAKNRNEKKPKKKKEKANLANGLANNADMQ